MGNDNRSLSPRTFSVKKKSRLFACAGVFGLAVATSANAALVSRLNGAAVYDTDLGITWLADANLAASNTFGVSGIATGTFAGRMNWNTAQNWIAAMNTASYLGFNDWRLPLTPAPDPTNSEMDHLFYSELGGTAGSSILTSADPDLILFQNIKPNYYWSTDYTPSSATTDAWEFGFHVGSQVVVAKTVNNSVWVVRTGDVLVPLPATFWLLVSGLMGMIGLSWKSRTSAK